MLEYRSTEIYGFPDFNIYLQQALFINELGCYMIHFYTTLSCRYLLTITFCLKETKV